MKRLLKNLLIWAGLAFICIGILEIALSVFFPLPEAKPYVTEVRQNLPGLKPKVVYAVNPFGFRAQKMHSKEKPPKTLRVLCLGASTTEQATQSNEDTWCGILETELQPYFKPMGWDVETAAYGIGGHRIRDTLIWTRQHLLEFQPDMVVILQGINDLVWNGGEGYQMALPPKIHFWQSFSWEKFETYRRARLAYLNIEKMIKSARGGILEWHSEKIADLRQERQELPLVLNPVRDPDPLKEFSLNLEAQLNFNRDHSISTLVLGQPVFWKENMSSEEEATLWFRLQTPEGEVRAPPAWLNQEMERYNQEQARLAELFGADFFNLNGVIPKDSRHFIDDCHFTDLGNAVIAEQILPLVKQRLEAKVSGSKKNLNTAHQSPKGASLP